MNEATRSTVTLSVPDISCAHCARTIEAALTPVEGVRDISVDIPAQVVQLSYDPDAVSLAQINELLAEEVYPVAGATK